jgi:hypothetical protein
MQPVTPTTARHGASRELINDEHLVLVHHVCHSPLEQLLCLQGIDKIRGPLFSGVVQVWNLHPCTQTHIRARPRTTVLLLVRLKGHFLWGSV